MFFTFPCRGHPLLPPLRPLFWNFALCKVFHSKIIINKPLTPQRTINSSFMTIFCWILMHGTIQFNNMVGYLSELYISHKKTCRKSKLLKPFFVRSSCKLPDHAHIFLPRFKHAFSAHPPTSTHPIPTQPGSTSTPIHPKCKPNSPSSPTHTTLTHHNLLHTCTISHSNDTSTAGSVDILVAELQPSPEQVYTQARYMRSWSGNQMSWHWSPMSLELQNRCVPTTPEMKYICKKQAKSCAEHNLHTQKRWPWHTILSLVSAKFHKELVFIYSSTQNV